MKSIMNVFLYLFNSSLAILFLPWLLLQGRSAKRNMAPLTDVLKNVNEGMVGTSKPVFRVLVMGESTVAGLGATCHDEALTGQIAMFLKPYKNAVNWLALGRNGYTISRVRDRLLPLSEGFNADMVVLAVGANDAFELTWPWRWKNNMITTIELVKQKHPNAQIIIAHLPPIRHFLAFDAITRFIFGNQMYLLHTVLHGSFSEMEHVKWMDELLDLKTWARQNNHEVSVANLFSDGIHPSPLGYRLWAERIVTNIMK